MSPPRASTRLRGVSSGPHQRAGREGRDRAGNHPFHGRSGVLRSHRPDLPRSGDRNRLARRSQGADSECPSSRSDAGGRIHWAGRAVRAGGGMIVLDREAPPRERTKRRDGSGVTAPAGAVRRRLRALVIKESLQIGRDPSSILIALVLPLILLFLFGYGVSLDANHVRIGVA